MKSSDSSILEAQLDGGTQSFGDLGIGRAHVGKFLLFAHVDDDVLLLGMETYNHAFVDGSSRLDEGLSPALGIEQGRM